MMAKKDFGVYVSSSFNEFGDAVAHLDKKPRNFNPQLVVDTEINDDAMRGLRSFNEYARAKGANLYFCYPSYYRKSYEEKRETINALVSRIEHESGLKILCDKDEFLFDNRDYFYDGAYHLVRAGVEERTSRMIKIIKPLVSTSNESPAYTLR